MRFRPSDPLPLLLLAGPLAAVLAWFDAPTVVRLPVGLLAVLLLPGYGLSLAVFPRVDDLDRIERLALSFGLSLAVVAILALGLHYSPWGLASAPVILALTGWTVLATIAAMWRRRGRATVEGSRILAERSKRQDAEHGAWPTRAGLTGVLLVIGAGLAVALAVPPPRLTEFFMLGPEGLAEGYPRTAGPGEPMMITVGITNREDEVTSYRVRVEAGTEILAVIGPVEVAAGHTWEGPVTFALPRDGRRQEIRIALFKNGQAEPDRYLRLWADGLPLRAAWRPVWDGAR
jgi:uncharacterized membrane protein